MFNFLFLLEVDTREVQLLFRYSRLGSFGRILIGAQTSNQRQVADSWAPVIVLRNCLLAVRTLAEGLQPFVLVRVVNVLLHILGLANWIHA